MFANAERPCAVQLAHNEIVCKTLRWLVFEPFERRHDGLWGVYRFKRGFGGELRRAAGSIDRVYQPLLYRVYLRRAATGGIT